MSNYKNPKVVKLEAELRQAEIKIARVYTLTQEGVLPDDDFASPVAKENILKCVRGALGGEL